MYSISVLTILFGFVALLLQKTYLVSDTGRPIEIEIPFLGKFKTNYPALAFLIFGIALAVFTYKNPNPPPKVEWLITGRFADETLEGIDWSTGDLRVFPTDFDIKVNPDGTFEIQAKIAEGKTFEDVIQRLDFSHRSASIQIFPRVEYQKALNGKDSMLDEYTETTRNYKPITLQRW